jgi:iron complex transport system substrate-binding protein
MSSLKRMEWLKSQVVQAVSIWKFPRQRDRWLRLGVIFLLTFLTACGVNSNAPRSSAVPSADMRIVEHAMGTVQVPVAPQRVVALSWLDTVFSLGVKPIGSNQVNESYLRDRVTGIENVGQSGQPSLEKILALNPDLILGRQADHEALYSQLSQIAPTVIAAGQGSGDWKETVQLYAEALGKTAEAQKVMADYESRLQQFKTQMGDRLGTTKVSVVRVYPDGISLYLKDSFCGTILADAGLSRPPAQNLTATEAQSVGGNPVQLSISRELLHQADGDVLFVWTAENDAQTEQAAQQKLDQLKADPLWAKLGAVQQNRVYQVPKYWIGSGPIAANLVIDDLFKYLLNQA